MKKKVNSAKGGKAVSKKGSREVNPFKAEGKVKGWSKSSRTYEAADRNRKSNPFRASDKGMEEDSVSFEYEAAEVNESVPEEDVFKEVEAVIKGKRRIDPAPEPEAEESAEAEAPVFEAAETEEPTAEAPEIREEAHSTSEETAKKIWLIESAAAVLASFLALIVASIY